MTRRTVAFRVAVALAVVNGGAACSDDQGDTEAFCAAASDRAAFESMFDEFDPSDVGSAITTLRQAQDAQAAITDAAPEAVQADVDILVRFLDDLAAGLESSQLSAGNRPAVFDELRPRFDQVEAASDRIELYVSTNC